MMKTQDGRTIEIEILTLKDIAINLKHVLPEFAKIIKSVSLSNVIFYKVSYPFGSPIIQNGKCYLPLSNGESINFNDNLLPKSLANDLSYDPKNEDPLGLVLSKSSEFYLLNGNRVMSHSMIDPGKMFGIPRAVDKFKNIRPSKSSMLWNLNAGARNLIALSKIGAKHRYTRLQKSHGIKIKPSMVVDDQQWPIFVEVSKQVQSNWKTEILYFSREWINQLKTPEYAEIANYLMQQHRLSYNIWHNTALIWETIFNDIEQRNNLNYYSNYALSTARQLFFIAASSATGLRPATNDESAPINLLKDVFSSGYGLAEDNQSNVIMESSNFNLINSESVYYSLNYPNLAQYNPDTFHGKSLLALLDQIQHVTNSYKGSILSSKNNNVQSLYDVASSVKFLFYHSNDTLQNYHNILNNKEIEKEDLRFTKGQDGEFPEHSSFFKGCMKICRI